MLVLNLQEDWLVLQDNSGISDTIIVSHATLGLTVQVVK